MVDEYRNHFHITVSIFKGITLGAAAYSLLAILGANGRLSTGVQFTALGFWLASFATMMVTYDAMMMHSLMTVASLNLVDIVIPFFYGIAEFSLFPILAPVTTSNGASQTTAAALAHLSWWPLGMTFIALVGLLYMINAQTSLSRTLEEFPPNLQGFIVHCKSVMKKDQIGTAGAVVFTLVAFLLLHYGFPSIRFLGWLPTAAELRRWEGVLSLLFIANACQALWNVEQLRRQLLDLLCEPGTDSRLTVPASSLVD